MAEAKERMQIRLSKTNVDRLQDMADRYGMTSNSLVSYIVGQWLDNNYDLKDKMREQMLSVFQSDDKLDKLFNSQAYMGMLSGLIREMVPEKGEGDK